MLLKHQQSLLQVLSLRSVEHALQLSLAARIHAFLEISIPVKHLGRRELGQIVSEELFDFVSEVGGPLLGAESFEDGVIEGIRYIRQRIELQELRSLGQLLALRVKEILKSNQFFL